MQVNREIIRKIPSVWLKSLLVTASLAILIMGLMLFFFDPPALPPLKAISSPFASIDYSNLPAIGFYEARDGTPLAYRHYPAVNPRKTVVLVHGSSGSGHSMHALAQRLRDKGFSAYTLDMRGHGNSGKKGDIAYVGQLEDDLQDFATSVLRGDQTASLAGFSSGGGFVLRLAGSSRQSLFAHYILLSPYLRHDAPTVRQSSEGVNKWAAVSVPRIIALSILGSTGEARLGHLPVLRFAVEQSPSSNQVAQYSFRLWSNFKPHDDFKKDIRAVSQRLDVIVGQQDRMFAAEQFTIIFRSLRPETPVTIVPGLGHMTLTTAPAGAQALADVLDRP